MFDPILDQIEPRHPLARKVGSVGRLRVRDHLGKQVIEIPARKGEYRWSDHLADQDAINF